MLAGRHIVLGVTGGVAAYKAAYLARRLIEVDAEVRVVMTESATKFVAPATFAALTGDHPVTGLFDDEDVSPHTTLAAWADAIVVAPATAASISRMAHGESSNALIATVLASTAPVLVAPAMHTEMWEHPATQENMETIRSFGYGIVGPEEGALAGGDMGLGRMSEPDAIVVALQKLVGPKDFEDTLVLITAGGTREALDPVRYIGNRSSGKMGNALAEAAADRGASVVLVTTADAPSHPRIEIVSVETASEMADAVWARTRDADVAIMAAAVADFRPAASSDAKLRRANGIPAIELEATPDVLKGVVETGDVPIVVGFAAEAGSLDEAVAKTERKGVSLLVANDIAKEGSGFGSDTNEVTLVRSDLTTESLPLMSKRDVADAVLTVIAELRP
ncbi:MAG: bifunctional phosphopantothenoylcysteine decarboxylase/phosphopantothenate--cysteine ligase CoaBC [Acidimicrobiia bacterium]